MSGGRDRRYEHLLACAGAALLWERLWSRLWPLASIIGAFVAISLLDLLPRLPGWLHLLVLLAFAAAALAAAFRGARGVRLPRRAECRRRLENDSGLNHRPLAAREDRLAAGADDPAARELWDLHRSRLAAAASRLRVGLPSPGVARLDPWGVRAAVVLLLAIGLAAAGGGAPDRLQRALSPNLAAGAAAPVLVELWITPPAYTGLAPIFLGRPGGEAKAAAAKDGAAAAEADPEPEPDPVMVPQGSRLEGQVSGVRAPPLLGIGPEQIPFRALVDERADRPQASAYRVEAEIEDGARLEVRLGSRSLGSWPIRVVTDAAPKIAFAKSPEAVNNGQLAVAYTAADDYGVTALAMDVRLDTAVADPANPADAAGLAAAPGEQVRIDLPLPTASDGVVSAETTQDLAAHRWAGALVRLRLEARDALGQLAVSEDWAGRLPERTFNHPVAKAIVGERKRLNAPAPPAGVRYRVAARLDALARAPAAFGEDVVVALALSVARARLLADGSEAGIDSVRDLLWATALHLDEGDVPRAERVLAEARAKLMDALSAGADDAEIDRLADALEEALAQYLEAVAAELARRGGLSQSPLPSEAMLGGEDLRNLVEMAREMARTGARDGARELLNRLQAMLDGIRGGLNSSTSQADMAEAGAIMQGLRDLADAQQRLLDETFARLRDRDGAPTDLRPDPTARDEAGDANGDATAARQEDLRQRLGDMMRRLDAFAGVVPPALGAADLAMRGAKKALMAERLGNATGFQGEAVQALRDSLQDAGQALAQRLGAGMVLFSAGAGARGGDPFGRSPGEQGRGFGVGEVEIPERGAVRRAGEILEELRRRAGERQRPDAELQYIERLLRLF